MFEGAGFDAIKFELAYGGTRFNLAVKDIADQAKEWLEETEAKLKAEKEAARVLEQRRYVRMLAWTIIGAVAAIVAAATGILALLK